MARAGWHMAEKHVRNGPKKMSKLLDPSDIIPATFWYADLMALPLSHASGYDTSRLSAERDNGWASE